MTSVITGNGLGLSSSSLTTLTGQGSVGNAGIGQDGTRVYVNGANGNLVIQRQDELLIGLGPDVGIVRTYNSQGQMDGDNNDGWQVSLYRKLGNLTGTVNTAGSTLKRYGADGTQATYSYDATLGMYVNKDGGGAYDTLSYTSADNIWTWTNGSSQITETYAASPTAGEWRVTAQQDLDGNALAYTYDATTGLISQISDANGETTKLIYDTATKCLTSVQVVTGAVTTTRTRYTYDASGRLATVTTDLTPADGSIADGKTYATTYTYDGTSTRVASITNSDGTNVSFTYDTSFRVKTVVDGIGKITTFTYNAGNTTVTDPLGQISTLTYDTNGNLTRLQGPTGSGQDVNYAYNANGDLTQLTDSRGNTTVYTYDTSGNLIRQQDAAGNVVERSYDGANQLVRETVYAVPDPDGAGAGQAGSPQTTYYVRDAKQHLRFVVSPEGRVSEYRYDSYGQQTASLTYTANTFIVGQSDPVEADLATWAAAQDKTRIERTDTAYDARGLVSTVTGYGSTDSTGVGVAGTQSTIQYIYDSTGLLLQKIDPRGVTTTGVANDYLTAYAYDGLGRTLSTTQYDAAGSAVGSGATRQTLTTFNDAANRVELTLANGLKRISTFDRRGLMTSQVEQDGTTVLSTQSYQYDADGQLRVMTDPNGNKTYYLYDIGGRKVGEIDAGGGLTEYVYDNAGLVTRTVRYINRVSQSLIDALAADPASGTLTRSVLPNSLAGWSIGVDGAATNFTSGMNLTTIWRLAGEPTMWLRQVGVEAISGYLASSSMTVSAGTRYEVAAYTGAQRATANLAVVFYDAVGNMISEVAASGGDATNAAQASGGVTLASYKRLWGFVTAPTGAVTAKLIVRKGATNAGQADSYVFVTHPYLAEAAATQTVASPFDVRPAATSNDPKTRFIYDAAGRLRFAIDARGYVTEKRYDGAGRLLTTVAYANIAINAASLDSLGREATPADLLLLTVSPSGAQIGLLTNATFDRVTRNFYDNDGLLRGTLDGEGYLTEYKYDTAGQLIQTIRYATATTAANRAAGTLATLIASANAVPANNIQSVAWYNNLGQLTGSLDGEGYYTAYGYDLAGNRIKTIRYANRLVGSAVAGTPPQVVATAPGTTPTGGYVLTNAQDQTAQAAWTAFNQLDNETAVNGTITKYAYDLVGNRLSMIIAQGAADTRTLTARYDKQGRLTQELSALGAIALAALGASPTQAQIDAVWTAYGSTYAYDAAGRRTKSVDANGNVTLYFYDAANRLTYSVRRVRNPANTAEWQGEVTARQYNALGQLTAEIGYANRILATRFATLTGGAEAQVKATGVIVADAVNDSRTDYTYQLTGQLSRSTVKLNATQNAIINRGYNAFGELSTLQIALDATRSRQEQFAYDRRGLLLTDKRDVVWTSNTGATGVYTSQTYDAFGRVITRTDGNSIVSTAAYDKLGRQVQTISASGSLNLLRKASYDAFGRVLTQTDARGYITNTAYAIDTTTGKTTITVTTPENIVTKTVTDRYGQTLTVVDGLLNETRYAYDANGNLLTTKRWDKVANVETTLQTDTYDTAGLLLLKTQDANGNAVSYSYDAANRLLTRIVDPGALNLTTTYAYDAKGQAIQVTDPNGVITQTSYDLGGRVILVTVDPAGLNLRTQYSYDLAGNRLTVIEGYGSTTARTTQYSYDSLGRRTQTVVDPAGLNLATTYAYDKNDNLVTKVAAAGTAIAQTTRYAYDQVNRLVYSVDALGEVTKNDYDAEGHVIQTTAYAKAINLTGLATNPTVTAIAGLISAGTSPDRITRYAYDKDGRQRFIIDALGAVTEIRYDNAGNVTRRIAYANALTGTYVTGSLPTVGTSGTNVVTGTADRTSVYVYDAFNRLTSRTEAYGTSVARTESWAYDAAGNTVRHTDGRGYKEWFAYDKANRLSRHIDQAGYVTDTAWNADGSKQSEKRYTNAVALSSTDDRWAYSGHSANPVANTDAVMGDRTTSYTYDKAGRTQTRTDALNNVTRYAYDALGNVTDTTVADGTAAATVLHRTYDLAGRVLTETRAYGTTDASQTTYGYNALGNQTDIVIADGTAASRTTSQGFDLVGRKTSVKDGNNATTTTTYNAFGDIVKIVDANNNAGYFYTDALGRVSLQVDPEGAVTETRYDLLGNTTETIKYANKIVGTVDEFTQPQILAAAGSGTYVVTSATTDQHQQAFYDVLGRKSEIRTWWGPNAADYYSETFTYDGSDNTLTAKARNGAITTYYYDNLNRKTREVLPVTSKNASNVDTAVENRYAYDALGNLTTRTEAWGLPEQRITGYTYDKLNRQVKETGQAITTFNPVSQADEVVTPVKQSLYDARGNLVEEVDARGGRTLHYYDAQNRETGRIDASGACTAWTYDAAGNKTAQTNYANAVQVVGGGAIPNGTAPGIVTTAPTVTGTAYIIGDAANDRAISYTYDGVGRQTGTAIAGMTIGAYDPNMGGGTYNVSTANITTGTVHDALGNVVKTIDGNGNVTRSYYNKADQKLGQLDAKRYLTVWTRDACGNVLQQTQYANAVAGTLTVDDTTTLDTLIANTTPSSDDRITIETYDKLNRVKTETRKNVATGTVNGGNGALSETTADATTSYDYDGLDNITRKTDSAGAATDWTYDGLGRKTQEQKPGYVDYLGATVRPTTDTEYDGLNHIKREIIRGTDNSVETDDRITVYTYGTGGFLTSQTDAAGAVTQFRVDANGNITKKTLMGRGNADGTTPVNDATLYQYDALNRQVKSTDVTTNTTQELRYDAFGEITGKRTNGGGAQVAWQEFAQYDRAGRAWMSNSGDGVTKVYLFDANCNATLTVQSSGEDLTGQTMATVIARNDTLKTISVFDARNQLTDTFEPTMDAVHQLAAVQANSAGQAVFVSNNSAITIGAQSSIGGTAPSTTNPVIAGGVGVTTGSVNMSVRYGYTLTGGLRIPMGAFVHVVLPDLTALGDGNLRFDVAIDSVPYVIGYYPITILSSQTIVDLTQIRVGGSAYHPGLTFTITVYKLTSSGDIKIAQTTFMPPIGAAGSTTNTAVPQLLSFRGQPTTATQLRLAYRPAGSTAPYAWITVPQMTNTVGATMTGWFSLDWAAAGLSGGNYEFQYYSLDSGGAVVNQQSGTLNLTNPAAPAMVQNNGALGGIGGAGRGLADTAGNLNLMELGDSATSAVVKYRVKGSNSAWNTITPTKSGTAAGWFTLPYASYFAAGTTYELDITSYNGSTALAHSVADFSRDASGNPSISAFTSVTSQPAIVHLTERSDTAYVDISYRLNGSTGAYATVRVTPTGAGLFDWDATALVAVATSNYDYDVVIKAYSASELLNNQTNAVLRLGANAGIVSANPQTAPLVLRLTTPQSGAASIKLGYRLQGSTGEYTTLGTTLVFGEFRADLSGLALPTSGSLIYEYVYDVYNSGGALLGRNSGNFTLQPATTSSSRLDWVIQNVSNVSNRIHKSQSTNAFGEVVQETDGLGHVTDLSFNTLGQLVKKQDPLTNVTLANGFQQTARPTTRYVYDLAGRLVATIDPNGNTSTQVWLTGGEKDQILRESHFDALNHDFGFVTHGYDIYGDKRYDINEVTARTDYAYDQMGRVTQVKHPLRAAGTPGNTGSTPIQAIDSYTYDAAGNRITHTNALTDTEKTYYDSLGRVTQTKSYLGFDTSYSYVYSSDILGVAGLQAGGWQKTTTDAVGRTQIDQQDSFGRTTWHQDEGARQFTYSYNAAGWLTSQTGTNGQNIATDHYANGYIKSVWDKATGAYTSYEYDAEGNRIFEGYIYLKNPADLNGGVRDYYQYATLKYDELNRLTEVLDPKADIQYEYDANGNRIRVVSSYHDGLNGARQVQDYWYEYDAMNRFTVTMGGLSTGARGTSATDTSVSVVKGTTGVAISYDAAGERRQVFNSIDGTSETYTHSADGYVETVTIKDANGNLQKTAQRSEDLLGRVTTYTEWDGNGKRTLLRTTSYDQDSRTLVQEDRTEENTRTEQRWAYDPQTSTSTPYNVDIHTEKVSRTTNRYYTDTQDSASSSSGAGQLAVSESVNFTETRETKSTDQSTTTTNSPATTVTSYFKYDYWDDAKEVAVTATPNADGVSGWQSGYAKHVYDVNGHLAQAIDAGSDGVIGNSNDRTFRYTTDAQGLIMVRDEIAGGVANRVQRYYYANGVRVGEVGNDGPSRVDYAQAIAARGVDHKNYRNWKPVASADFDQNYEPIGPSYPGMTPSSYTVRAGDTLQSIARAVWGDSSLWYLIADANGLTGTEALDAGQMLTLPNKVTNIHNNAGTFRPYNAGEAIGNTSPTLPDPPPPPVQDEGCGTMGAIIVIIVIVVVAAVTEQWWLLEYGGGEAAGTGSIIVAGAVGGAAGAAAGQLTGMALGMQDHFDWGAVAAGALTGAATAGMGTLNDGKGLFAGNTMLNAAAGNIVSQGINNLTGQQKGFSWSSVAVSGISAPVTQSINDSLFGKMDATGYRTGVSASNQTATMLATSSVSALVSATTRIAIVGGKIQWEAVAADALSGFARQLAMSNAGKSKGAAQPQANTQAAQEQAAATVGAPDAVGGEDYGNANASGGQAVDAPSPYTVGSEGGQGFWGVAKSMLGPDASNAEIQQRVLELMTANPGVTTLHVGDALNLGDGSIASGAEQTYNAMDAGYQNSLDAAKQERIAAFMDAAYGPKMSWPVLSNASSRAGERALPEIELQRRYSGGVTRAASMGWSEAMNTNNSWDQRLIFGALSLAATPAAMMESVLYAPFNVTPAANELGQTLARVNLQTDPVERNLDILRSISLGAEGFTSAGSIFSAPTPKAGVAQRGSAGIVDDVVANNTAVAAGRSGRQSGFIFRGDARTPDVIFNEGFQPRGTKTELYNYALNNEASIFVPTSKTPNVARIYAENQSEGYVYTIRGQSQGVDVNAVLGSRSPFPLDFEIAVPGGVPSVDIMGARLVGPNGKFTGPFIKNPTYTP